MIYTPLTKRAMCLCNEAHKNQKDRGGCPYVFHPYHIAEQMNSEDTVVAALLHDFLEDTYYTVSDLKSFGIPDRICEAIELLTREDRGTYIGYIYKLSKNPIARAVKIEDLKHNLDLSRLNYVDDRVLSLAERYKKALKILENVNNND